MNSRAMSKYRIEDKHRFAELRNFAMQYPVWKAETALAGDIASPNLDGMPRGSMPGDPVGSAVASATRNLWKVQAVETAIRRCSKDVAIQNAVLKGVTTEYSTYEGLRHRGYMWCGRDAYYLARRKFFWELDKIV